MGKTEKSKHKSRIRKRKQRRQLGSRMYKNYSEEMLEIACEAVKSKQISSRDAERQFGIPRRTIVNKINNKHTLSVGHPTALTDIEDNKIVKALQVSSEFGSPLTKLDLKLLVHEYLKKNSRAHKFKNCIPGDAWVQGFLARHGDKLTLRTTQNISKARAEKGPEEIADYFDNLSRTLKDIPAENILNLDETNLSDDPGSSKAIFRRGVKYPERVINSTKGNISLMFTATASGQFLPLYVVYKATNLYSEWITGGPPNTRYNCTKSGWFDSAMFEDYFKKIILPWAQNTAGTKVVICDNLSSHLNLKVVELCEQYNIKLVFIPPRSTHITQPLDVAFFAPLKKAWRKILYQYKLRNPNQTTLNKNHFSKLLSELIGAIQLKEAKNIKIGFRASGIFPLDPREVLKKIPEMQEEILSYGIDQALVDYLKESRAPKPMLVKRNKKVNCEPGKSVTAADFNMASCKDAIERSKKNKAKNKICFGVAKVQIKNENSRFLDERTGIFGDTDNYDTKDEQDNYLEEIQYPDYVFQESAKAKNKIFSRVAKAQRKHESSRFLDERTGIFGNTDLISNDESKDEQDNHLEEIQYPYYYSQETQDQDCNLQQAPDQGCYLEGTPNNSSEYQNNSTPESLCKCCINTINFYLGRSVEKRLTKIKILSNVLITAGMQMSNVRFLSEISNTIENKATPLVTMHESSFPGSSLEERESKFKNDKKGNAKEGKKHNRKLKVGNLKGKKSARRQTTVKKKKIYYSESSSISADGEIITADSDISDYENYVAECLRDEKEEKENLPDLSFGLKYIEYFTENQNKIKVDDWIMAQFATKKSLKHFVGKVVSINDMNPTVKFVRKVKQSKCENGTTFTYPIVDDICTMRHSSDVISVLPKPNITRRGQILFNADFRKFNVQ